VLPSSLLRYELCGRGRRAVVSPAYLDLRHIGLARRLLEHYRAFDGKPYGALHEALRSNEEASSHEPRLVAGLERVIEEHIALRVESPVEPALLRGRVFTLGKREQDLDRDVVLARVAAELSIPEAAISELLYADLRGERIVRVSRSLPSPAEIVARYNFRLVQGLVLRAERLRIALSGSVRAVYRLAKLNGLLVVARRRDVERRKGEGREVEDRRALDDLLELEISGPLSLFRSTRKYGYALARFLPACCLAERYRIEADLLLDARARLSVSDADRVLTPHRPAREFDSKVEQVFYRDFVRLGSRWHIARETELLRIGPQVFIPDFTFRPRDAPQVRIDLEIVGFWTPEYLARKLALLAGREGHPLIVCVDEKLAYGEVQAALPPGVPCVVFRSRVPAAEVLDALEATAARLGRAR
jgi:hypothetical protein